VLPRRRQGIRPRARRKAHDERKLAGQPRAGHLCCRRASQLHEDGADPARLRGGEEALVGRGKRGRVPELWDGQASARIAEDLANWLRSRVV